MLIRLQDILFEALVSPPLPLAEAGRKPINGTKHNTDSGKLPTVQIGVFAGEPVRRFGQ